MDTPSQAIVTGAIWANATTDWLRENPLVLIPLMGITGVALLLWGIAGLALRLGHSQRAPSLPRSSVMLIAMVAGLLLIAWAAKVTLAVVR